MAEGLTFPGLREAYAAASPASKLGWWLAILLLLALPLALFWYPSAAPENYRVLYAGLSDRDGGEVVEALEKLNIPYRLAEADGAVEVPAGQLHVARYKLAAQGLPRGDKAAAGETAGPRFGLSPQQEQQDLQRALEAELARSVESLEAVASARVHLALPRQSTFLREQMPPAASVLVRLKPGLQLGEENVEAVRQIVAGGVPGMNPAQVSVVDQSGALLAAGLADNYRGLSANQLDSARRVESDLAARISRVLAPVLGHAAFKVQVTAKIDFGESGEAAGSARPALRQLAALILVDEAAGKGLMDADRLAALARQAVGFDGARGDSLQVILLPFTPLPAFEPEASPVREVVTVPPAPALLDDELLPVYAGLGLAFLLVLLLLFRRARLRRREAAASAAPAAEERFEARLDSLRQRVLTDPKVAASVVKLWMQQS